MTIQTVINVCNNTVSDGYFIGPYFMPPRVHKRVDFALFTSEELEEIIKNQVKTGMISSDEKSQKELEDNLQALCDYKSSSLYWDAETLASIQDTTRLLSSQKVMSEQVQAALLEMIRIIESRK